MFVGYFHYNNFLFVNASFLYYKILSLLPLVNAKLVIFIRSFGENVNKALPHARKYVRILNIWDRTKQAISNILRSKHKFRKPQTHEICVNTDVVFFIYVLEDTWHFRSLLVTRWKYCCTRFCDGFSVLWIRCVGIVFTVVFVFTVVMSSNTGLCVYLCI